MKRMKKIASLLCVVCLAMACFSMTVFAANGKIMFEDPATKVGDTLKLKGVLQADGAIEDRTVVMSYDTTMLKFTSGDNVAETAAGQLTYKVQGQQSGNRVEFFMNFDVLKEGTTKVEVISQGTEAYTTSNTKIVWTNIGNSTITIAEGTPTTTTPNEPTLPVDTNPTSLVIVGDVSYTLSEAFTAESIPEGFTETTMEYDGAQRKFVVNQNAGITLGYLVDVNGAGSFYMYVAESASFVPFKQIKISDSTTITLLSDVEEVELPEAYTEVTLTVDGIGFPAWQNGDDAERCIMYAMNSYGEKSLYQFDKTEATYQRIDTPTEIEQDETPSFITKLSDVLGNHMDYVILGVGVGLILFIIIIIVLSVKLYNRNAELDELYDEYGIGLEEDNSEEELFIRIDDEIEEDVVLEEETVEETIEEPEKELLIIAPSEKTEEIVFDEITEVVEKPIETPSVSSDLAEIARAISDESGDSTADDDSDSDDGGLEDFEIDFIDLDD